MPCDVAATSRSDTIDGWRDRRFNGGIVVDVQPGEIVIGDVVEAAPSAPRGVGAVNWFRLDAIALGRPAVRVRRRLAAS